MNLRTLAIVLVFMGVVFFQAMHANPYMRINPNELQEMNASKLLFDDDGRPTVKLLQLLNLVGMETPNDSENALMQINAWAQKNLLRQGERWEKQTDQFEKLKPVLWPLLKDLGFVDATLPHFKSYQGAIIHGGTLSSVRLRLHYLNEQWKEGVRFTHLYFLSSARPLEDYSEDRNELLHDRGSLLKIREDWNAPSEFPKTECEMIRMIWEQSAISDEMRAHVDVHFINSPMKKDTSRDKWLRPTTDDTVEDWLKTLPQHGRYLAITNAPYTNRQDSVMRTFASNGYSFDTIGFGADENERMAIFLDEVARMIFQIRKSFTVDFRS